MFEPQELTSIVPTTSFSYLPCLSIHNLLNKSLLYLYVTLHSPPPPLENSCFQLHLFFTSTRINVVGKWCNKIIIFTYDLWCVCVFVNCRTNKLKNPNWCVKTCMKWPRRETWFPGRRTIYFFTIRLALNGNGDLLPSASLAFRLEQRWKLRF